MTNIFKNFDFFIFLLIIVIFAFGAAVLFSVAPKYLPSQLTIFLISLIFFFIFSQIDYRIYKPLTPIIYGLSLILLLTTMAFGRQVRGSTRWLVLGPLVFQTSEIVKPMLIISFSGFFLPKYQKIRSLKISSIKHLFKNVLILFLPLILIFKQPDLGSTLIIAVIWLGLIFISGFNVWILIAGCLLSIAGFPIIWHFLKDYQRMRLLTFLTPGLDPKGAGYHAIQAMIAVGSGGLLGKGLGMGTQSHLRFLPEFHTDFIFASLAEELGLFGSLLFTACYLLLLWRLLKISQNSSDAYGALVCLGIFSMIFSQVFINIGMNIGILPITGITLPLVSYGGSSLVSTMIALGIAESIAKRKKKEKIMEIK